MKFLTLIVFAATSLWATNIFETHVNLDLLKLQQRDAYNYSIRRIQRQNEEILLDLKAFSIDREVIHSDGRKRLNSLSYDWAVKAMRSIDRHPVVSSYQYDKYNNKGVEIGFCFGRATYVHLALLKMGVNKDAIRKIWMVGPMKAGNINWAFHVATIVKADQGNQWWVVDNYPGEVLEVSDWVEYMSESSSDGKLKVYITKPNKFSVSLGKYSRVQMGLDLPREQDWYSHYFVDMLDWFSNGSLEDVRLKDLRN